MKVLQFVFFLVALNMSSSKRSSKDIEGYPAGMLSDCPGAEKESKISRSSLKHLKFVVYNNYNVLTSFLNNTSYNYYQMKKLSNHLDLSKKTVLFVNGYLDSNYLTIVGATMGSFYKRLDYNVLSLEYNWFSSLIYPKTARLLRPVGKHTAEMLAELTQLGLDPKKLQLIGISLGGQAVSFIAKNYQAITGLNVSRVTGLDPSGPCFRNNGPEDRIDSSDADFVDIIHTNIDGYGIASPVGHVDFYINGGEYQPGDFVTLPCGSLCSHTRSFTIWLGALMNPDSFIGMQCDSVQDARDRNCFDRTPFVTNVVGLNVDKTKEGIFYVMSNNVFPYGMGTKGLKKKSEVFRSVIQKYNNDDILVW